MSRTDKDRPYHVRVRDPYEDTIEQHHHCDYRWPTWRRHDGCDLEAWKRDVRNWRRMRNYNCSLSLRWQNYWCTNHVPKWYVDHVWNNVERTRERTRLRESVKLANAGSIDGYDFPSFQHRHRASWYWD